MADNYCRLICFIVNICPEPLRELFIQLAKKDAGFSYTSLNAYLTRRKLDIDQLHKRKLIRTDQRNLIFPRHGTGNESDWDVTLLVTLITNLFEGQIQTKEIVAMNEIRNTRNALQHISNTANISNTDFKTHWERLEFAATALAQQAFSVTEQASFKTKIDDLKKNCFPNLVLPVGCLRPWNEDIVKHTSDKSNDRQTNSILHNVTVKNPGPAGDEHQRIPDDRELLSIAKHIGRDWEALGAFLGIRETRIDHIKLDNPTTPLRIFKMLKEWRDTYEDEATVETLYSKIKSAPSYKIPESLERLTAKCETQMETFSKCLMKGKS